MPKSTSLEVGKKERAHNAASSTCGRARLVSRTFLYSQVASYLASSLDDAVGRPRGEDVRGLQVAVQHRARVNVAQCRHYLHEYFPDVVLQAREAGHAGAQERLVCSGRRRAQVAGA
jgi:hypothetical protein